MVNLLILFWNFFKIGLFTFGGGYAMIPMIEEVALNHQWIGSTAELYAWIGISEATPGPFAVNIATFIGFQNNGLLGAFFATLGVVLPSWIIIVLIASLGNRLLNTNTFKNALKGIRPVIIVLIFSVTVNLIFQNVFKTKLNLMDFKIIGFDWISLVITSIIMILSLIKFKRKKISPIYLLMTGGILGLILYHFF